jgi:hypothetical protein
MITEIKHQETVIELTQGDEYMQSVREVSDYFKSLPLSHEQNDTLINLMLHNTNAGREDAFWQGFNLGIKLCQSMK